MNSLIHLKIPQTLTTEQYNRLITWIDRARKDLDVGVIVTEGDVSVQPHQDLSPLVDAIQELVSAISDQCMAIDDLVESNATVVGCFAEAMAEEEDLPQTHYLDGAEIEPGL